MEQSLTKLLLVVVSLALAAGVIGMVWNMYSGLSRTVDFAVSNLQVFSTGNNWKIMFKLKNTGTVTIDTVYVYVYVEATQKGSWSDSTDVPPQGERFYESRFVATTGVNPGTSVKVLVRVVAKGGTESKKVFDAVCLKW